MPTEVLMIGAGGHSKVVIEALQASQPMARLVVADEDRTKAGHLLFGKMPIQYLQDWSAVGGLCHVAIGDNSSRKKCSLKAQKQGKSLLSVIHPNACLSPSAAVSDGCFIAAKAVVAAESRLGYGCIINHGAVVDHDCRIGAYSHVAPNATLGGGAVVGDGCFIGAGATVLPMVKIGNGAVIGAGAVITRDVTSNQTYIGVPGKQVK